MGGTVVTHTVPVDLERHLEEQIGFVLFGPEGHKVVYTSAGAVKVIRKGLPLSSIKHVQKSLQMEDEGEILKLMQLSVRTYQRRKKDRKPLDPVESDRLYRLAKIQSKAVEVFQDKEVAVDWLKRPNRALGDIPLQLLDTEAGADMVERVLTRIEHGVYS
jgi:putative toxin-antitoxin system antitoxin component (TIGR02293 family)